MTARQTRKCGDLDGVSEVRYGRACYSKRASDD
jgi:hypothetical protein